MELEETREKIIKTATELFLRDGCKRVTMDNIATHMHISKRTLYEIFATKEELLTACIHAMQEEIAANKQKLSSQVDEPILLALFLMHNNALSNHKYDTFQEDIQRYYPDIYEHFSQMHSQHFHQEVVKVMREAQAKNIIRQNVDLDQVFQTAATYMKSCSSCTTKEQKEEWLNNVRESSYIYLRGLMTSEAIQQYDANERRYQQLFDKLVEDNK